MISFPSGFANHLFPFFAGEDFWVLFFFGYVVFIVLMLCFSSSKPDNSCFP